MFSIRRIIKKRNLMKKQVYFMDNASKIDFETCAFEGGNNIREQVSLYGVSMGYGTYISSETELKYTSIGKYCSIGPRVKIVEGQHPTSKFVSTCPAFFSTNRQTGFTYVDVNKFDEHRYADKEEGILVSIENDVWIGADARIMEGVSIGNGAIIAASSLVIEDVKPYSIVAGVPAKIIKYRFSEKQIDWLETLKWWDWNNEEIRKKAFLFEDITKLINAYE